MFSPSLVLDLPLQKLDGGTFQSRDAYGHLVTKTGALWFPQGHSFDGVDDNDNVGNPAVLQLSNLTLICWIKTTLNTTFKGIFTKAYAYAVGIKNQKLSAYDWGGGGWRDAGVKNIADDKWHMVGKVFRNNSKAQFIVDGDFDGDEFNFSVSNQGSGVLLAGTAGVPSEYFAGSISAAMIFSYPMPQSELMSLYIDVRRKLLWL